MQSVVDVILPILLSFYWPYSWGAGTLSRPVRNEWLQVYGKI